MSEVDTNLIEAVVPQVEKKARLWPAALVILLVVFIPAFIAWMLSMLSSR